MVPADRVIGIALDFVYESVVRITVILLNIQN